MKKYDVCVVGATGLVGQNFLSIMHEYNFPLNRLKLLASKNSAGTVISYNDVEYIVEELKEDSFKGYDIALFSASAEASKKYARIAVEEGLLVIDNSSAWRRDESVPLVVPEINLEDCYESKLIANPNCSTIVAVLALKAISEYGLKRVVYSTYQAVSGSGHKGVLDLNNTKKGHMPAFYPYNISKTCIPHIDLFLENGFTKEEDKMIFETKKILHMPDLRVSATCIRVPVLNCHGVSVMVELENDFELDDIVKKLEGFPGIKVLNDGKDNKYPTSEVADGNDLIYIGRIRKDISAKNGLLFYCVGDNIRKGAASNAVQIAVELIKRNKL